MAKAKAKAAPVEKEPPTADQREGYIGGSDAAGILGISPWATPMSIFADKTGRSIKVVDPQREDLFMFGHLMEPVIAAAVERKYGLVSEKAPPFSRSKKYPFMGGHVDFSIKGTRTFLECKNVRYESGWGPMAATPMTEDASHAIPAYYLCQCLHYMVLWDADHCYISVLIAGNQLHVYLVTAERNKELMAQIVKAEQFFWESYVVLDIPPPSVEPNDILLLRKMFPVGDEARKVVCGAHEVGLLTQIAILRQEEAKTKKKVERLRRELILKANGPGTFVLEDGTELGSVSLVTRRNFDEGRMREQAPVAYKIYQACKAEGLTFQVRSKYDDGAE